MTDLIVYETKRYRCPHCRRSYGQRGSAIKHVRRCFLSPSVRSCKTCHWFDFHQPEPEVGIMAPGYECHAADHPDGPEEDVNLHVDRCSTCGGEVYPDGTGNCSCDPLGPIAKPVFGLRVQCPFWEARDDR